MRELLADVKQTERGFWKCEFHDANGHACTLQ